MPPPERPCIFVSNHMSYMDSGLLAAFLLREVRIVAKAELRDNWITRLPLDRLGVEYVERFDRSKGIDDADRITASAAAGPDLLFFAEGTLTRVAGLRPFQMGAFVTAVATGVPVVPVAIRGTRQVLRDGAWFPRRGAVTVTIGAPVSPDGAAKDRVRDAWTAAVHLRDAVRAEILRHCGEPDLADERPEIFAEENES